MPGKNGREQGVSIEYNELRHAEEHCVGGTTYHHSLTLAQRQQVHDANMHAAKLQLLTAAVGKGVDAPPFVPGVMAQWEMMVGHSMTRWHWGSPSGCSYSRHSWAAR